MKDPSIRAYILVPFTYSIFVFVTQLQLPRLHQATFTATPGHVSVCVCAGTLGGLAIGLVTEYYTSHSYAPVREVKRCNI